MFTHDPFEHEFIERRLGAILVPRPARLNVDPLDRLAPVVYICIACPVYA